MAMNVQDQIGGNNLQNSSSNISNNSFIKHVTRFDSETKSETDTNKDGSNFGGSGSDNSLGIIFNNNLALS